jgi:hypothetical protein
MCPLCEGRGITCQLVFNEEQECLALLDKKPLPIMGTLIDRRCSACRGERWVSQEKFVQLTEAKL